MVGGLWSGGSTETLSELPKLPSKLEVGEKTLPISVGWPGTVPALDVA